MFLSLRPLRLALTLSVVLTGCATQDTLYPQCGRMDFRYCLDVDAQRCDALMTEAKITCEQRQNENTLYETMPDTMKAGHLNRCMAHEVAVASGQPEERIKSCMRW